MEQYFKEVSSQADQVGCAETGPLEHRPPRYRDRQRHPKSAAQPAYWGTAFFRQLSHLETISMEIG